MGGVWCNTQFQRAAMKLYDRDGSGVSKEEHTRRHCLGIWAVLHMQALWEIPGEQEASSPFDVGSEGLGELDKAAGLESVLFLPQLPERWDESPQSWSL